MFQVLVVDDDADILNIVELSLTLTGQLVTTLARDAETADAAVNAQDFDLIILDVLMPSCSGPELLAQWRDACIELPPVVFFTARNQKHEIAELMRLEVAAIISKPFSPVELGPQVLALLQTA